MRPSVPRVVGVQVSVAGRAVAERRPADGGVPAVPMWNHRLNARQR